MGVNGFFSNEVNSLWTGILLLFITYPFLIMIELNIGHALVALFIFILILYQVFADGFISMVCRNYNVGYDVTNSPM
jgi:hypothetical protein